MTDNKSLTEYMETLQDSTLLMSKVSSEMALAEPKKWRDIFNISRYRGGYFRTTPNNWAKFWAEAFVIASEELG